MPKLKKAARGKHRWVAFRVEKILTRVQLKQFLMLCLEGYEWRLFDVLEAAEATLAILKIQLGDYQQVLSLINNSEDMVTLTSSGKIRLARQRLNSFLGNDPSNAV
jgi:hypothetical protein